MTDHPITPPPELVEDWIELAKPLPQRPPNPGELATLAARWGANQELDACCEWLESVGLHTYALHTARRPKPPSLKEQALEALEHILRHSSSELGAETIRRALKQLDDSLPS